MTTFTKKRIFLVDDNEIDNYINQTIINSLDFASDIVIMTSAHKALNYLIMCDRESLPDLLFLDINMPAINGFDFLVEFKKLKQEIIKNIIVIILTSSDKEEDMLEMSKIPIVFSYLVKPLSEDSLILLKKVL